MKNTKRQAFTIVELVIVIAVIAILSAVLIPTFGAIIKDANIAADQSAAATLTTELHVALKGETIDSEEELMSYLNNEELGIGKKLVPKALAYGYHFWFDMESQMFIVETSDKVATLRQPVTTPVTPDEGEGEGEGGAAAVSAVLTAETTAKAYPASLRNIHNNGYLLVDYNIESIFGGDLNKITASTYAGYFTTLENAMTSVLSENYSKLAELALANLKNTVVINSNGTFFHPEATDAAIYYIAPGTTIISAVYYNPNGVAAEDTPLPTPAGEISLPSSVLLVEKDAFVFDGAATIVMPSVEKTASVFSAGATSEGVVIRIDNANYSVVTTTGEVTCNDNGCEHSTHTEACEALVGTDNATAIVKHLLLKLPFENFEIGYNTESKYVEVKDGTLYISYLRDGQVKLYADDTAAGSDETSFNIAKWTSSNKGLIDIANDGKITFAANGNDLVSNSNTATLTAKAYNIYGQPIEKTINVEVVIAKEATVSINGDVYTLGKGDQKLTYFAGKLSNNFVPTVNGVKWVNSGEIDTGTELRDKGELAFTDANGNPCTKIDFGTGASTTKFTVSIDGHLKTNFTVQVIDLDKSPFALNYHHPNTQGTQNEHDSNPYYIGSENEILLSEIFNIKSGQTPFANNGTAKVTVYGWAEGSTGLYANNEIKNYTEKKDYLHITASYDTEINASTWDTAKIKFITEDGYDRDDEDIYNNLNVVIEIAPTNGYIMLAYVTVVDGAINVTTLDDVKNDKDEVVKPGLISSLNNNLDVVLQGDLEIATGTTINVGAQTLYGNGYIIDATTYKVNTAPSQKEVTTTIKEFVSWKCPTCGDSKTVHPAHDGVCSDCGAESKINSDVCKHCGNCGATNVDGWHRVSWCALAKFSEHAITTHYRYSVYPTFKDTANQKVDGGYRSEAYLFNLSGGTIDNIYIDGPIYPTLDYETSTGYHVSGINASGSSTVSNSYVQGFRQPIAVVGGTFTLKDSTLYGGNYANLQLVEGSLNLHNVTTVQPELGIKNTFNAKNDDGEIIEVVGLGIVVERDVALTGNNSAINVTGYLNQYNWISDGCPADLPELEVDGTLFNLKTVLAAMFNGIDVLGKQKKINFLDDYIETITKTEGDETVTYKYLNAGIIFLDVGNDPNTSPTSYHNINNSVNVSDGRTGGHFSGTKFAGNGYRLELFSTYYAMDLLRESDISTAKLMRVFNMFKVDPNTKYAKLSNISDIVDLFTKEPLDVSMKIWSYEKDKVDLSDTTNFSMNWENDYYSEYYSAN